MKTKASKPGPACSVCISKHRTTIENALRRGTSVTQIAVTYSKNRDVIARHAKHMTPPLGSPAPAAGEPLAPIPANATPLERARINCDEARRRLSDAIARVAPAGDIAKLSTAYTSAEKHYAAMATSKKLTPEEIVKSPAWSELVADVVAALRPFPDAMQSVLRAMRQS